MCTFGSLHALLVQKYILILKNVNFYFKRREGEGALTSNDSLPKWLQKAGLSQLKPGAQTPSGSLYGWQGPSQFEPSFVAFSGKGAKSEPSCSDREYRHPIWHLS